MWLAEQVLAHAGTADFWWKSRLRLLSAGVLLLHMSCLNLSCAPRGSSAVGQTWASISTACPSASGAEGQRRSKRHLPDLRTSAARQDLAATAPPHPTHYVHRLHARQRISSLSTSHSFSCSLLTDERRSLDSSASSVQPWPALQSALPSRRPVLAHPSSTAASRRLVLASWLQGQAPQAASVLPPRTLTLSVEGAGRRPVKIRLFYRRHLGVRQAMGILARISLARALSVEGQTPLRPPRGPHFRQRAFLLCQLSHLRRLVVSRVARASQPT